MIDLVCAWCDVDARVFYRLKRAKYLVFNIYDATLKMIAVAKVAANIVIHICSSIAWQAGVNWNQEGIIVTEQAAVLSTPNTINCTVRKYLTARVVEQLMDHARKHRRYGHRDSTMILVA